MLADLLATDGVAEHLELRSDVGLMAIHGGLEANTWEIAHEVAARTGSSLYGVVQAPGLSWHVPSTAYALDDSPALASFCGHVGVAISLHGYGGIRDHAQRWRTICIGGGGRHEAAVVGEALRAALPDYVPIDSIDQIPRQYRGVHPDNPVNRVRVAGVQVELPPRVRGLSPGGDPLPLTARWAADTVALIDALVAAIGVLNDPSSRRTRPTPTR